MSTDTSAPAVPMASGTQVGLRASYYGFVVAVAAAAAVYYGAPEDRLDGESKLFLLRGVACGLVAGTLGNLLVARGALARPANPRDASPFLRGVVLDMLLQFAAVGLGVGGMFLFSVKFAHLAAFGLALAAVAMLLRILGTVVVNRALDQRARARVEAVGQRPHAQDSDS